MFSKGKRISLSEVAWFLGLAAGLFCLYLLFKHLGFSENASKGLSLLALLSLVVTGLFLQCAITKLLHRRRFAALPLEEQMAALDRLFEEQVRNGAITREELQAIRAKACASYDRRHKFPSA